MKKTTSRLKFVAVLTAILALAASGLYWQQTENSYKALRAERLSQTETRASQLANAMGEQISAIVRSADFALHQLRDAYAHNPTGFDSVARSILKSFPDGSIIHIAVIGADGYIAYSTLGLPKERIYAGDRQHFKVHLGGKDRLEVSPPVFGRASKTWTFLLTRPIYLNDKFLGVAVVSMSPAYMSSELAKLEMAPTDVVALMHPDGSFLGHSRNWQKAQGKAVGQDRPYLRLDAPARGVLHAPGSLDSVPRLIAWYRLSLVKMVVGVGIDENAALAPVEQLYQKSHLPTAAVIVLILLLGGSICALLLQFARQQQSLSASKERLVLATNTSGVGIWDWDVKQDRLQWEQSMFDLYHLSRTDFAEAYAAWIAVVHPGDRERLAEEIKAAADGTRPYDTEFRITWPGGEVRHIKAVGHVFRDDQGAAIRMLGANWDVTERKKLDDELQSHRVHLEELVEERTDELSQAKEEAERANRAKTDFLARMSHELRTPMNAILGFSQVLEVEPLSVEQSDYVREIHIAGDHLLELINDLLDLSRIESGQFTTAIQTVSLAPVIEQAAQLVKQLQQQQDVALFNHCADVSVLADSTRLKQVLVNLLSNAVKYNRAGGSVHLNCEVIQNQQVRISVTDTGPGIAPDKIKLLFRPFERLGAELGAVDGTGIGLALSKRLTELMGGTLGVESSPGIGSTFWIDLPFAQSDAQPAGAAPSPPLDASSDKFVVLYIEDDAANLRLVEAMLKHQPDITLLSATNGEQGIEVAKRYLPDAILLDIHLPGMDGYAVLEALRLDAKTRSIPVIALSADAMPVDIERGLKAGFADYLTKPIRTAELVEAVAAVREKALH